MKQLTATIKSMLTIEINGIEKSFREASELMTQASKTMDEKIKAAGDVITEARDCVESNTKVEEETMENIMSQPAPSKNFVSTSAPKADNKPAAGKPEKKGGFAFDMSELIKDAEASVTD